MSFSRVALASNPWAVLRGTRSLLDRRVWLLTYGQMLLSLGRGVLMPFATLYFYDVRHFPLALIGLAFAIALPTGSIVGLAWGALSDRIGRRPLMLLGMGGQAVTTATLAFVTSPAPYILVVVVNAIFVSAWSPAARAMIADVTPGDRRARAFGLMYLANNFGLSFGLVVGGVAALVLPYRVFFFAEAAGALGFLGVVIALVQESHRVEAIALGTGPGAGAGARVRQHLAGLSTPLRDPLFLLFAVTLVLAGIGWAQFYSTYSPYIRDFIGAPPIWVSVTFAVNCVMVVFLQIPIAARVDRMSKVRAYLIANYLMAWSLLLMWAAGRAGSVANGIGIVLVSNVVMTIGEIMVAPVGGTVAAGLARTSANYGKYMAAFDLTWTLSSGLGATLGGAFFDAGRPMLLWPVATLFVVLSFVGFAYLGRRLPADVDRSPTSEPSPMVATLDGASGAPGGAPPPSASSAAPAAPPAPATTPATE